MNDGQIVFEVTADGKHAIANIKDITRAIENESKKWDNASKDSANVLSDSFGGALKKLKAAFTAAAIGKALLDIGKAAIQAASDLEEVQNVVDVTFGDSANEINAWAQNAIKQFGLTETQAKRFASTMGAMLKSSGLAGSEISKVSTDLAGLAADMASFYNLDFDTAFQKIRSGLAGETEPLKQLGINMSVANLEAFALSKGITKAFKDMSQGEQTMLRYQYLMQATADAQGDFARTTDGYANGMRLLESNIDTLKTKLGAFLLETLNPLISMFNEFLGKLTTPLERTVLDDFNDIDADTSKKLSETQETAESAQGLIDKLNLISETGDSGIIGAFAEGANKLDSTKPASWLALMNAFKDTTGITNLFEGDTPGGMTELAAALSGESVTMSKAEAWKTFLDALANNSEEVSKLTGKSATETATWLKEMATNAALLDPEDAEAWNTFMTALVQGIDTSTPEGQKFVESMAASYLALGKDSDIAKQGLATLGYNTDQIADKQREWLKTCKALVQTIPGLSDIIDTETGAVKGGIGALSDYVDEWKTSQEKIIRWKQYYKKRDALINKQEEIYGYELDAKSKRRIADQRKAEFEALYGTGNAFFDSREAAGFAALNEEEEQYRKQKQRVADAEKAATEAEAEHKRQIEANAEATEILTASLEVLEEECGDLTDAEKAAAEGADDMASSLDQAGQEALSNAKEVLKELADYVESVSDSVRKNIEGAFKPFEEVQTHTQKLKDMQTELQKLQKEGKATDEINIRIADENDLYTLTKMKNGLQSQIEFLKKYNEYMAKAQTMGFSNAFLAQFTDGSIESYNWLEQLVNASPEEVKQLNALYEEKQQKTEALTKTLTEQKLTVDDVYQEMADRAKEAVAALDMEEDAATNSGKTVEGIVRGINDKYPDVKDAVDGIIGELQRLSNFNIDTTIGGFGQINPSFGGSNGGHYAPGHASGLDYVPFDNYFAKLHKGEAVLTAEENKVWQGMRAGQYDAVDYDRLGGVMAESVKPGGNVYLDGKAVGTVISDRQGREFRTLQRSGWQA